MWAVAIVLPVVLAFVLFGVAAVLDGWLDRPFTREFERPSLTPRSSARADDFDEAAFLRYEDSPPTAAAGS